MQAKLQARAMDKKVTSLQKNIAALQRRQTSLAKLGKPSQQLNFVNKDLARKTKELQLMERQHQMAMKQERATGTTKTRYAARQLEQQQATQRRGSGGSLFGGMMSGLFGTGSAPRRPQSRPPSGRPRF